MIPQAYDCWTPQEAYDYCGKFGRNENLEKIILTDPHWAYRYAKEIIKGRWIEAEKNISTNSYLSCLYAKDVIKGRWIEVENIISTPNLAYNYARNVIKSRWKEAENIISADSYSSYRYAKDVIKGKLPELMHNMMLLHADYWAKQYLNFINNLTPSV